MGGTRTRTHGPQGGGGQPPSLFMFCPIGVSVVDRIPSVPSPRLWPRPSVGGGAGAGTGPSTAPSPGEAQRRQSIIEDEQLELELRTGLEDFEAIPEGDEDALSPREGGPLSPHGRTPAPAGAGSGAGVGMGAGAGAGVGPGAGARAFGSVGSVDPSGAVTKGNPLTAAKSLRRVEEARKIFTKLWREDEDEVCCGAVVLCCDSVLWRGLLVWCGVQFWGGGSRVNGFKLWRGAGDGGLARLCTGI